MINLLPPELKQEYRYARYNRRLLYWLSASVLAIGGVVAIATVGLLIMGNNMDTYKTRIATAQTQLANQNVTGVQQQVTDMSNNLKLMVTVLSKEILFSKLLAQLGTLTPPNVVLTNLSISQTEKAIDITAQTANYNAATQLQVNLADPHSQIFSKADIVNINCASSGSTTPGASNTVYPCTVDIKALFTSNNPFLFINQKAATS